MIITREMAARVGTLRLISAFRGVTGRTGHIERSIISSYQNTCRRSLSSASHLYQKYISKDHEWILVDEGIGTVGITDHAQQLLGDLVFVELPEVGDEFSQDDAVGTVESVKAASDVLTPVSGLIVAINEALDSSPNTVNKSPETDGWMFQIQLNNSNELKHLMSVEEYAKFIEEADED